MELGGGAFGGGPNCLTSDCLGNFRYNTALPLTTNQQTYKIDQQLGRLGSVFFRYTNATYTSSNFDSTIGGFRICDLLEEKAQELGESPTPFLLSKSIVNNFRFGHLEPVANQGGFPATGL